jgi:uncharacterized damage-inducible protein DinB
VTTPIALPEPDDQLGDAKQLLLDYLDYYRSVVARKVHGLPEDELRSTRLPSGWSPLELVKHLVYMERRWLEWGFLGAPVEEPWGDRDENGRWAVRQDESATDLVSRLHTGGERTRIIVEAASLPDLAAMGGRFGEGERPPTLAWILFHVLQEYARHAGHLDIVRELVDGSVGE